MFYNKMLQSKRGPYHGPIRALWPGFICVLFFLLPGCSIYSAIPVAIDEFKDLVFSREQSYSYPLNNVLKATVFNLDKMGFVMSRIEHYRENGLVHADWEDTRVKIKIETITPTLTKVSCSVWRWESAREHSSEEALFDNIQETLKEDFEVDWDKLTGHMALVHIKADETSPVIAYLGPGEKAEIISKQDGWGEIELEGSSSGYIPLEYLQKTPVEGISQ
jgi:hypothetical protein